MDLNAGLAQAIMRKEVKTTIDKALARLPPNARRDVLLEFLADLEPTSAARPAATAAVPAKKATKPPPGAPRRPGRPRKGAGSGPSKTDRLLALLRENPGAPILNLAVALYEDSSQTAQSNIRSLLAALKTSGRVRNIGPGKWEAVPSPEGGAT